MKIMDKIETASGQIKQSGVIAILRGDFSVRDMLRIGEALMAGTITVMEVTLNSPSSLTALPQMRHHFGDEMLIGAGTVRDVKQARQAIEAGRNSWSHPTSISKPSRSRARKVCSISPACLRY